MQRLSTRLQARLILATLIAVLVAGLWPTSAAPANRLPPPGEGDVVLYRSVVDRVRAGEGYYQALGEELRRRGYATIPVFNWRTPAHLMALAWLSIPVAVLALRALATGAMLLVPFALARQAAPVMLGALFLVMGALATALRPEAVLMAEVWAGVFIALSLCAYHRRWWSPAAILGVLAIFVRELAAPYGLACGTLALVARRRRESLVWIIGGLAYAVYFTAHAAAALAHRQPGDLSHIESWVRWNGFDFLLATISVGGWHRFWPDWASVVFAVAGIAGMATPHAPGQIRLALLLFILFFAAAGQPFNYYWGFVSAPIWAFAVTYGVKALPDLIRAAGEHRAPQAASSA